MKSARLLAFLFSFSIIFLFSCKKENITGDDDSSSGGGGTTVTSTVNKTLLLQLVNDVRSKGCNCGSTAMPPVAAVTWNAQLEAAAYAHADDMYKNNYFSHDGKNGSTPGDRIKSAGYNWKAYGENIAKGYTDEQAVINAWLGSEGHCKNIMGASFKEMGVAKVDAYWVQEFGAK